MKFGTLYSPSKYSPSGEIIYFGSIYRSSFSGDELLALAYITDGDGLLEPSRAAISASELLLSKGLTYIVPILNLVGLSDCECLKLGVDSILC